MRVGRHGASVTQVACALLGELALAAGPPPETLASDLSARQPVSWHEIRGGGPVRSAALKAGALGHPSQDRGARHDRHRFQRVFLRFPPDADIAAYQPLVDKLFAVLGSPEIGATASPPSVVSEAI